MEDEELLARFDQDPKFRDARNGWTEEQRAAFCKIARAVNAVGLDWYRTNIPEIRFGRRSPSDQKALGSLGSVQIRADTFYLECGEQHQTLGLTGRYQFDQQSAEQFASVIEAAAETIRNWIPIGLPREPYWPDETVINEKELMADRIRMHALDRYIKPARDAGQSRVTICSGDVRRDVKGIKGDSHVCSALKAKKFLDLARVSEPERKGPKVSSTTELTFVLLEGAAPVAQAKHYPTNLILYGPPGTGKTYRTALKAVELCDGRLDPAFDETEVGRKALMGRYNELKDENRIAFVTFHQNYDYETFVEGLRPETGASEGASAGFRLVPQPGIFRSMCERADQERTEFNFSGRRFWKMAQGTKGSQEEVYRSAIANNYIALGWGGSIDWSSDEYASVEQIQKKWSAENPNELQPSNWTQTWLFRNEMEVGDIVIVPDGNHKFRAIGLVTGNYRYDPSANGHYPHLREVRWLVKLNVSEPLGRIYEGNFTQRTLYPLPTEQVKLFSLQSMVASVRGATKANNGLPKQFVLIIDEINRANVSKVFGELITLIEKDKRLGMGPNELTLTLPYSKEPKFGVPCNLHIIGTMNTADRSIAPLDTALRRRFTFLEMAPNPALLEDAKGQTGINLVGILETINDRIEYLIDRDHRIGHAFFMGCRTKDQVDAVMRETVIPLLQEYFFEDWRRIAAVLGGGFIGFKKLKDPMGKDPVRDSWFIRKEFSFDAYERLRDQQSPEEIPEEINVEPNQQ